MTHATVFLILDAGRADYVQEDTMPFLHGLAEDALTGRFESPPGFAQRTVFFTGRYPDTSGNFSAYEFNPDESPFAWTRRLGPLGRLVQPRKVMWPARWSIEKITGALTDAYHTDPAWIPPPLLPYFRPCEDMQPVHEPGALGGTSIFDLCREHDLDYRYLAHPVSGDDDDIHETLVRELRDGSTADIYIAQLSATDELGHHHGPQSDTMQDEVLPDIDGKIASVHAALEANHDSWNLFVCGDHGMAPVEERVNVIDHLDQADATAGEDYVVFVNSTIAVLWYLHEDAEQEIEPLLEEIPGSHTLDEDDRKRLRIPRDRRWGDRMVAAEPGVLFWPDYFHVASTEIEGMHGYLDKSTEDLGMCVIATSDETPALHTGDRDLVDVFPTLCDLAEVPIPDEQEGQSLLQAAHEAPPSHVETAQEAPASEQEDVQVESP